MVYRLNPATTPAPDDYYVYPDGTVQAVMFPYIPENVSMISVATELGFEVQSVGLEEWAGPDDGSTLWNDYLADDSTVLKRWNPIPPEGFTLAAKFDGEDGPVAVFVRSVMPPENVG